MSNHTPDPNGWGAYERLVLAKLEELSDDMKDLRGEVKEEFRGIRTELQAEVSDIRKEQTKQDVAIAMLNVKSGIWGAGAAVITLGLYIGYSLLGGGAI